MDPTIPTARICALGEIIPAAKPYLDPMRPGAKRREDIESRMEAAYRSAVFAPEQTAEALLDELGLSPTIPTARICAMGDIIPAAKPYLDPMRPGKKREPEGFACGGVVELPVDRIVGEQTLPDFDPLLQRTGSPVSVVGGQSSEAFAPVINIATAPEPSEAGAAEVRRVMRSILAAGLTPRLTRGWRERAITQDEFREKLFDGVR